PRSRSRDDAFTPRTVDSASMVSPTHTGAPKRMSMYSRFARPFSETSSTLWLKTTFITRPGGATRPRKPYASAYRRFLASAFVVKQKSVKTANRPSVIVLPRLWRKTCPGRNSSRKLPCLVGRLATGPSLSGPRAPPSTAAAPSALEQVARDRPALHPRGRRIERRHRHHPP